MTDEDARKLSVSLDFLSPNKNYEAQIYRDGPDADWKTNPYAMVIEKKNMKHGDTLQLSLATSGGAAIRFKALD